MSVVFSVLMVLYYVGCLRLTLDFGLSLLDLQGNVLGLCALFWCADLWLDFLLICGVGYFELFADF